MKNVTITLDVQTVDWLRIEAAKAGKSMSRFVADELAECRARGRLSVREREAALASLERFLSGPGYPGVAEGLGDRDAIYDE